MRSNHFNKNSIFFTINIAFIISIIIVAISFYILFEVTYKKEQFFFHKRSIDVSKMVLREYKHNDFKVENEFKEYLQQLNFLWIGDFKDKEQILNNDEKKFLMQFKFRNSFLKLYQLKTKKYIILFTPFETFILEDLNPSNNSLIWILLLLLFILSILLLLYFMIINKLKPLQKLHTNVLKLSNEEFDIDCMSEKKDEISLLSNEFHTTVQKLKKIKESRNIFIRNIMHELKTPITKGKFLSELEQTPKNNEKLKTVFLRLETLIQEFASIEELISTKKELLKKEYLLEDILDESLDLLMIDNGYIQKEYDKDIKLEVDFKLFTIAVKNLLDNGLKYSNTGKVFIKNENDKIVFINDGEPLQYPLEQYFEPFFKGKNTKSNESFGLGLYIIYHILKAHRFQLTYQYEAGKNYFIINPEK